LFDDSIGERQIIEIMIGLVEEKKDAKVLVDRDK